VSGGTTEEQKILGLTAKAWLKNQIEGELIRVVTVKGGDRGNFGRFLVWVYPDGSPTEVLEQAASFNMAIIDRGWGVPYAG